MWRLADAPCFERHMSFVQGTRRRQTRSASPYSSWLRTRKPSGSSRKKLMRWAASECLPPDSCGLATCHQHAACMRKVPSILHCHGLTCQTLGAAGIHVARRTAETWHSNCRGLANANRGSQSNEHLHPVPQGAEPRGSGEVAVHGGGRVRDAPNVPAGCADAADQQRRNQGARSMIAGMCPSDVFL